MPVSDLLIERSWIFQDGDLYLMARVRGKDAAYIQQSDIASISYTVTDTLTGTVTDSGSPTASSVVFDSLQTDDERWTRDGTGYNFRHEILAAAFPEGGRMYDVNYAFVPATGGKFRMKFSPTTEPTE